MSDWLQLAAQESLARLLPRVAPLFKKDKARYAIFEARLRRHWLTAFRLLHQLYGAHYDFFYHLEQLLISMAQAYLARPDALHVLDAQREAHPDWYQSEQMVGGVCYVDLFAGDLQGIRDKIPYFKELGLSYLHLMPLFKAPEKDSDGGYAISDFRQVNPALGTMDELRALADELRANGISLALDFVFNHTSNEHVWAQKALSGDPEYQRYYYIFPDRTLPDQYERTLREIFPEQAPGSFTYQPQINAWVWTTFKNFQWDLNYANPTVFIAMLNELLFLANQGVEVLRLDAVAFIWKQMGTTCENLPQAHWLIRAYNAILRVVAPSLIFKSEAIVHPDMVASYISLEEAQISYHPTLMALLWESLATREIKLLRHSMQKRFGLPEGCAWVNYVRVHDDIGWTFADEDAAELGIDGYWHRQFLNRFYIGQFEGSFAKGVPFNYNPINQDMRISGTGASLAGLEQAQQLLQSVFRDHSLKRILLIHSVILSVGGIPLLYLGDEIATLNDYSYKQIEGKSDDSRWVHRPAFDWERAQTRRDPSTAQGWLFLHLVKLIEIRKATPAFGKPKTKFFDTWNGQVLGYILRDEVLVLANFSERDQIVSHQHLISHAEAQSYLTDLVSGVRVPVAQDLKLAPYQFVWLTVKA